LPDREALAEAEGEVAEDEEDEAMGEVWAEVYKKREEWHAEGLAAVADFRTTVLGGDWMMKHVGMACDAHQGKASTQAAQASCVQYNLPKSARFATTLGDATAALLARAWAHRANYYYRIYLEKGPGYHFTAADHEEYDEPKELVDALRGMSGAALTRVESIRAFRPSS